MPTQNVNLTPELERFVKELLENGEFNSASEVHRAALSAMARAREERELRLQRIRLEVQKGLDSGPAAEVGDIGEFLGECAEEVVAEAAANAKVKN